MPEDYIGGRLPEGRIERALVVQQQKAVAPSSLHWASGLGPQNQEALEESRKGLWVEVPEGVVG